MIAIGITVYGVNSWVNVVNQEQQINNQEFISNQINEKFTDANEKRNIAFNKTLNAILDVQKLSVEIERNIIENLTDHRENTHQSILQHRDITNQSFQKIFKELGINDSL